jgi:hypothetical protein
MERDDDDDDSLEERLDPRIGSSNNGMSSQYGVESKSISIAVETTRYEEVKTRRNSPIRTTTLIRRRRDDDSPTRRQSPVTVLHQRLPSAFIQDSRTHDFVPPDINTVLTTTRVLPVSDLFSLLPVRSSGSSSFVRRLLERRTKIRSLSLSRRLTISTSSWTIDD